MLANPTIALEQLLAAGRGGKARRARKAPSPPPTYERRGTYLLSIDPSIASLGWAVFCVGVGSNTVNLVTCGTWHPSEAQGSPDRFSQLAKWMERLLHPYASYYDVAVEVPSGGLYRMKSTAFAYCRAIGVVEGVGEIRCAAVHRIPVTAWKGNTRKSTAAATVKAVIGYEPRTDHEADAIALGLWFLNRTGAGKVMPWQPDIESECFNCHGTGRNGLSTIQPCGLCGGTGRIVHRADKPPARPSPAAGAVGRTNA